MCSFLWCFPIAGVITIAVAMSHGLVYWLLGVATWLWELLPQGCWPISCIQVPDDMKLFWQALLSAEITVGSFLKLPSNVYLLGLKRWGGALLVRHCYRDLFDQMMDLHSSGTKRRFCITGTPGIGKSFFAVVLMGWLVKEKKVRTIVFDTAGSRYLFTFYGMNVIVKEGNQNDFRDKLNNSATWWIIDMGPARDVCEASTVLLASHNLDQYLTLLNLRVATALHMPLWTDDEIEKCRSQLFPTLDAAMVQTLMLKWGNIPRYVLEKVCVMHG
ncbi:hypothetical protein Vretifemale_12295 [Volvox reticuliferus]|uniref:Helicase HerA central domain-containing protein n=1 Tax=Volvox reticuliferus TaxID=1737510 RepID=A0A8J4CI79_9CHLO|nr:hypothetical protein Vretifemale_12295 [Volvox reticuliferus]